MLLRYTIMRKLIVFAVKREKSPQKLRPFGPPSPLWISLPSMGGGGGGVTILPCDAGHQHKTRWI